MIGARSPWTGVELRKTQRTLRRLQSPLVGLNDFNISLNCPERPEYEDINPSNILDRAHYVFKGEVDNRGELTWTYECELPGNNPRHTQGNDRLVDLVAKEMGRKIPRTGAFEVIFHVWDRSREMMKAVDLTDVELDAYCGVSLYRDEFRVLPYGEAGDDWLGLDARRINVPSRRVGNRNIVGLVNISHDRNPRLKDKTNREGLQENGAFEDLRAMVRGALMVFEVERLRDREALRAAQQPSSLPLLSFATPHSSAEPPSTNLAADTPSSEEDHSSHSKRESRALLDVALLQSKQQSMNEELYHLAATGLRVERLGYQFSRTVFKQRVMWLKN